MSCLLVYHTHFYKKTKKFVNEMYLTLLSILSMVGPHNVLRERSERTKANETTPCPQSFPEQSPRIPSFCVHSPDQLRPTKATRIVHLTVTSASPKPPREPPTTQYQSLNEKTLLKGGQGNTQKETQKLHPLVNYMSLN